jgi:uncharacterized protein (DUF2062 family)
MSKKKFRRFVPDEAWVRNKRYLRWTGRWLHHPALWRFNRHSVAGGVAIGMFAGMIPGPLQMLAAAALAIPLRKNLPVALATTFYTNPLTIVPLYLLAYAIGKQLLGVTHHLAPLVPFEWDWSDWIWSSWALLDWTISLGPPLALGLVVLAISLAALGYCAVHVGWRAYVVLAWRKRNAKRKRRRT